MTVVISDTESTVVIEDGGRGPKGDPGDPGSGGDGNALSIQGVPVDDSTPTFGVLPTYDASTDRYILRNAPGGVLDVRDVPDEFGNVAVFDGVTPSGLAVAAAWLYAHAHKLVLRMPGGDCLMLDPDGNPVLIQLDQNAHKWALDVSGAGKYATTLQYPVNLGLVVDPTDLTLCGDPSGRVANFAIDALYTNKTNRCYRLRNFALQGPAPSDVADADPHARARGWGIRMGGRAHVENVDVRDFHARLVYRPRFGSAHSDKQIDHNTALDCSGQGTAYAYYWSYYSPVSGLNAGDGDHVIERGDASQVSVASFGFDPAGVMFDSKVTSVHKGAGPQGWLRELGPKGVKVLPSGATVARDAAGVVTLATNTPAAASTVWPGVTIPPALGFVAGDVVELAGLGLALASDDKQIGRITNVTSPGVATFLMEAPITGSAFGATSVATRSMKHHFHNTRWLDSNIDNDGTDEGCGTSFMRCVDGDSEVRGYPPASVLVHHGNEVIGRTSGHVQAESPVPVLKVVRTNLTHPGLTAVSGDIMAVTVTLPAGTPVYADDHVFLNTPTSGPWQDDLPAGTGWSPDPDRCRGKWRVQTATDDITGRLITFFQVGSSTHLYTEKTIGDGSSGSGGSLGRVCAVVVGGWTGMEAKIDAQHESQSGFGLSEFEVAIGTLGITRGRTTFGEGSSVVANFRKLHGVASAAFRTELLLGDLVAKLGGNATLGEVVPGQVLQQTAGSLSLFDGTKPFAGVALYRSALNGFVVYAARGVVVGGDDLRNYGFDFPANPLSNQNHGGVLSLAAFLNGDILAGDPAHPGYARKQAANDVGTMQALGNSVGPTTVGTLTGVYITPFEILDVPVAPLIIDSGAP